jgi:thiol-disulfide isomerase/thioredoxin
MQSLQKYRWVLLVFGFGWQLTLAQAPRLQLYVFLSPECPLCQNYTRTLNLLEQKYAGAVTFHGIIPGKTWKKSDLTSFAAKYRLAFPLQQDRDLKIVHSLHATTTPEAILLGADNTVIYQGAIDNWYKSLGKAGNKPTEHYLQDAIDHTLRHEPPLLKKTVPIGCEINDF